MNQQREKVFLGDSLHVQKNQQAYVKQLQNEISLKKKQKLLGK